MYIHCYPISQNSQYLDFSDSLFKVLEHLFSASRRGILRYRETLSTYRSRCLVMLAAVYVITFFNICWKKLEAALTLS